MTTFTRPTCRKVDRTVSVLSHFDNGVALVEIVERTPRTVKATHYYVRPLPADFGKAFRFEKFAHQGGEVYEVNVGGDGEPGLCCCLGHERWGHRTVCRHVACARALLAAGKLS